MQYYAYNGKNHVVSQWGWVNIAQSPHKQFVPPYIRYLTYDLTQQQINSSYSLFQQPSLFFL